MNQRYRERILLTMLKMTVLEPVFTRFRVQPGNIGCTSAYNVDAAAGIERGDIDDGQAGEIVLVRRPL